MIKEIEHTADRGIEVRAESIEALFAEAAEGMIALISEKRKDQPIYQRGIEIKAMSREKLLIRFLSEILYLVQDEYQGFAGVEFQKLSETKLRATLYLFENPEIFAEIKNVTYHNFSLELTDDVFVCRIIFDM